MAGFTVEADLFRYRFRFRAGNAIRQENQNQKSKISNINNQGTDEGNKELKSSGVWQGQSLIFYLYVMLL